MATIEECLLYELTHNAGVVAIASTRGYPLMVPLDTTLPAWAYQRISGIPDQTHEGPSGLVFGRFQITCLGDRYTQAVSLENAIRACLDGFTGTMGGAGGLSVWASQVTNMQDGYGGNQEPLFEQKVRRMDIEMWYWES